MKRILQHKLHILCLYFGLLLLCTSVSCHAPELQENKDLSGLGKTVQTQEPGNNHSESKKSNEDGTVKTEKPVSEEKPGVMTAELLDQKPNELGEIMILMYHEIGYLEAEWTRTPENFRRDLETLYEQGYRAVPLMDFVKGNIDIPAGTSPVVFTFDDGNKGNFYYEENESELKPASDCAVGIMEDFYQEKPDFGLAATFFIYYPNPFRESQHIEKKLNYLVSKGFEIGNHTHGHADLSRLNSNEIQRELALHVQKTQEYVAKCEINSLALPYGSYPKKSSNFLLEGSFDGTAYKNEAVLLVGANPSVSPFHEKFNVSRLPRIRASEMKTEGVGLYDWLDYFQRHPDKRYVSDGDPRYVTAPKSHSNFLNEPALGEKKARFYPD
ncbi:MAG: polysaccharide deacetylase family protein [Firmicutes bacterium]|nr:polysaccharide deacetylase family protein [Bacillota bacterium]